VSLGDERNRDVVIECVRMADVFLPNEAELQRLTGTDDTGTAVAAAAAWGTPLVVTRGAAGALIASPDGTTEVAEGVRKVKVRDLTGAGDAFAGALIAALLRGVPLTDAVVAANAAGSEAVGRLGAVGEVEVAGISTAGQTLGARFIDQVAAAVDLGQAGTAVDLGQAGTADIGQAVAEALDPGHAAGVTSQDIGGAAAAAAEAETEPER
jgi:fructose-1-phosphate kinase PfkB-like protein